MTSLPDEVITHAFVRDVALPSGTLALITLDNGLDHTRPSTFGPASIAELDTAIRGVRDRADRGEIVAAGVTGKPFIFAVGADLSGVPLVTQRDQALEIARAGHATFAAFADLPVPTFAFVNGAALGGGVELALAATYRTVSSSAAALALPECFLGLVPGWGGCYLLPRLVGPVAAVKVIIENALSQNRMLKAADSVQIGLADAMIGAGSFLEDSLAWTDDVISGRQPVARAEVPTDPAEWDRAVAAGRLFVDAKVGGTAPAPYRALDLIAAARTSDRATAFAAEDEALADLLMGDELRAGLYAFDLVQKRAKRPAGVPAPGLARPVTTVGIVGAGLMASQLALLFVQKLAVPVCLTDLDADRVARGVASVHAELDKLGSRGRLHPDRVSQFKALVTGSTDLHAFAKADFVIEAVFEDLDVKKQVFADVEAVVAPTCILATNTSSLSVSAMAADLAHPERVVGFHFFNPVAVMPLLEIIRAEHTDDVTLATAFATGKSLRKTCILVADSPSFVVNRLLGRFMGEVGRVVDDGTPIEVADAAFAGLAPMPPFVLMGLVGPAIAMHNGDSLVAAFPDRFHVSSGLRAMVAAGKSSFYTFADGQMVPDPSVVALLHPPADPVVLDAAQVRERVLAALADEARRMLDEGVVSAAMDIDLAMITGAGFAFHNGGLTPLLDRTGVAERVTGRRFLPAGVASVP